MKVKSPFVFLGRVLNSIRRDELVGRSAEIAFYLPLAVFPSLLVLVSLLGFLALSEQTQSLAELIETALPPEVAIPLLEEISRLIGRSTHGGLALGLGLALSDLLAGLGEALVRHLCADLGKYNETQA